LCYRVCCCGSLVLTPLFLARLKSARRCTGNTAASWACLYLWTLFRLLLSCDRTECSSRFPTYFALSLWKSFLISSTHQPSCDNLRQAIRLNSDFASSFDLGSHFTTPPRCAYQQYGRLFTPYQDFGGLLYPKLVHLVSTMIIVPRCTLSPALDFVQRLGRWFSVR
jgi:hypothetical protein